MSALTPYRRRLLAHRVAEMRAALDRLEVAYEQDAADQRVTLVWITDAAWSLGDTAGRYARWMDGRR